MLPTDTVLDLDYNPPDVLKSIILLQGFVPMMRASGMSDDEIIETTMELIAKGLAQIVEQRGEARIVPTTEGYVSVGKTPPRP